MNEQEKFDQLTKQTKILRFPKYDLATFGATNIRYYLLAKTEFEKTKIVEGTMVSERPKIVTLDFPDDLFEGFGDAGKKYAKMLFQKLGSDLRMLEYRFKNFPQTSYIESDPMAEIVNRINKAIDLTEDKHSSIIHGNEEVWEVSLMQFIVEMTLKSLKTNIMELEQHGLLGERSETEIKDEIEHLFKEADADHSKLKILGKRLKDYGLFTEYEDRFYTLLK